MRMPKSLMICLAMFSMAAAGCSRSAPAPTPESSANNAEASAPAGPAPQRTNQDEAQGATGPATPDTAKTTDPQTTWAAPEARAQSVTP
jgi:hypothetical protein